MCLEVMMQIGYMSLRIKIYDVFSLKEKRSVVKSLIERLKHKFNISVCEGGENDILQLSVIGIVFISNERRHIESTAENIIKFMENDGRFEIISISREVL